MNKEVEILKKYLENNEYKIAEEYAINFIKKYPDHYIPYLMHGICCMSLYKYAEAKKSFLNGIKIDGNKYTSESLITHKKSNLKEIVKIVNLINE